MTKIAIISQPEQGVLIDVGGCATMQEATQHLTYTLQVSSQFWEDQPVDLNLGSLSLNREEVGQVLATLSEVGLRARHVFAEAASTRSALRAFNVVPAAGRPASLPGSDATESGALSAEDLEAAAAASAPASKPTRAKKTAKTQSEAAAAEAAPAAAEAVVPEAAPAPSPQPAVGSSVDASPCCAGDVIDASPSLQTESAAVAECMEPAGDADCCAHDSDNAIADEAEITDGENADETTAEPAEAKKEPTKPTAPHVMYLRQTLRSGQAVSHKGHLVIIGDVNPGAEVIAEGDITIWGTLRGIAHAGVGGNLNAEIRALRFDPIQLRIAHAIARSPDRPRGGQRFNGPETARIVNGTIRISVNTPE